MEGIAQIPLPSLTVVTGRAGSGKTRLAHLLAREIRCPAICRDEIKEGFVNTVERNGEQPADIDRQVYETFFDSIRLLLDRQITLIAEAAFQHERWAPKLEQLREIARIRIVVCEIDSKLARIRRIERDLADPDRERFHADEVVQAARSGQEISAGGYDPPHLEVPTLTVDTSDGYKPAIESIVSFSRA